MSTPLPPRPPSSPTPSATRQLLDELDALMERMLALPVNDLGDALEHEAAAPPQAPAATAPIAPLPPPAEDSGLQDETASPESPALAEAPGVGGQLVVHAPSPAPPAPQSKLETPPVPLGAFWPPPVLPRPEAAGSAGTGYAPASRSLPALPHRPVLASRRLTPAPPRLAAWWERLLIWMNRAFDRWTCRLGRPGRWLQGTAGRTVLGWLGISLLCVAAVWGLRTWFDWTW